MLALHWALCSAQSAWDSLLSLYPSQLCSLALSLSQMSRIFKKNFKKRKKELKSQEDPVSRTSTSL